ncbi:transposase [Calidifontibacillus oryziterrae]|uniref:transposase n=1 Tax=Calidifontibacillus oryziterrae TaxID=1191699 RepID=UPI00030758E0|nr:transposase [Calidifontibacillus oryziterrae]
MPRKPREKSSSGIYHIILRGINKQLIFEDDVDRTRFLDTLKKYKEISKFQLFSYCLMDNHVHLLLKEKDETISESIKRISSSYVHWYNTKYKRCGHLFQDRFRSECVENRRYFLTVLRYIHQNPLKAGLAENVFENKWTSIHEYIGVPNLEESLVDIEIVLKLFSPDKDKAINLFIEFMQEQNDDDHCLDDKSLVRWTDQEVADLLHEMGIANISMLQQMDIQARNTVISSLKAMDGISTRQLSRVTGISKSVIDRA